MRVSRKRFVYFAAVLLVGYVGPMFIFLISRPPLSDDSWALLEKQRPTMRVTSSGTEMTFFIVADGLNFALARRPIGGWESASVKLYQLLNLPAFVSAHATFHALEARATGTSKLHSDIATGVFVTVGSIQWLILAAILGVRRSSDPAAA